MLGQALLGSEERTSDEQQQQEQQRHHRRESSDDRFSADNVKVAKCVSGTRSYDPLSDDDQTAKAPKMGGGRGRRWQGEGSSLGVKRSTSVEVILQQLAAGNTILARGDSWKLTRAVVHTEDAWKGRVSPCPLLEKENARKLFKLRWKHRWVDVLLVHLLLVLSLVEIPPWCVGNNKCFWTCYPDFLRNWHLQAIVALVLEAVLVVVLVAAALLDVVRERERERGTAVGAA